MRRRIVSLLLVPLVLANHALCLAHSHQGTGIAHTDSHGDRPHFHWSHGHHSDRHVHHEHHAGEAHGHDGAHDERAAVDLPPALTALDHHDADALYVQHAPALAVPRDASHVFATECLPGAAIPVDPANGDTDQPRAGPLRAVTQPASESGCPVYLRTLSLRL